MMQFYADTVKKMAHCHFVSGSPLRTLCLLIAGQPADVFNSENTVNSGSLYAPHQPVEVMIHSLCSYISFWTLTWSPICNFVHCYVYAFIYKQIIKLLYHGSFFSWLQNPILISKYDQSE